MGGLLDLFNVLYDPTAVFARVKEKPRFWGPFLGLAVLQIIIAILMMPYTRAMMQAAIQARGGTAAPPAWVKFGPHEQASLPPLDFPGYAIGGLAVGEPHALTCEVTALTTERLPAEKPRYLMGVGRPEDIAALVVFLASEPARHITGTTIQVDGGSTTSVM